MTTTTTSGWWVGSVRMESMNRSKMLIVTDDHSGSNFTSTTKWCKLNDKPCSMKGLIGL